LQNFLEGVALIAVANRAARYEVSEPEGVERRKFFNAEGLFKPIFPTIVMLLIVHTSHALQI
jgi:hypothetical protein